MTDDKTIAFNKERSLGMYHRIKNYLDCNTWTIQLFGPFSGAFCT